MMIGLGLYIIPLSMIRHPELAIVTSTPFISLAIAVQIAVGVCAVGARFNRCIAYAMMPSGQADLMPAV